MAILTSAGTYFTPQSKHSVHEKKIDDVHIEIIRDTITGGTNTIILGTDTSVVNNAIFAYAQNATGTPAAAGVSTPGSGAVSTTVVNNGANAAHDMFIIGGERGIDGGTGFYFERDIGQQDASGYVWELAEVTLDGSGDLTVAGSEESSPNLSVVARPMFVMATEIKATAPDTAGVSVSSITSIDFVLKGANNAVVLCLVCGLRSPDSPTDDSGTDIALREDVSLLLHNAKNVYQRPHAPLIGEIVDLTLVDGDSLSAVSITTANLNFVKQSIEGIFPMTTNTTEHAVSWNGTRGVSSGITSLDGSTSVVKCLVLGY